VVSKPVPSADRPTAPAITASQMGASRLDVQSK
jgi:hypothetical protein